jgi:hypothetical protein
MATGRIGVTPTLGVRWSKAPAAGTTSLSGLDDNSVSLVYSVGYEQVYRNGVLLSRGNDYTATNGTTVTLTDATVNGDIIEIFANELVPLADAISKGQFTAKGSLLSASAASTPAVLAVGSNDQVLTADSSTTTGLKWATPSSGGMTLLSTTSLNGVSTVTISSISGSYTDLQVIVEGLTVASGSTVLRMQMNGASSPYTQYQFINASTSLSGVGNEPSDPVIMNVYTSATKAMASKIEIPRYTSSANKMAYTRAQASDGSSFNQRYTSINYNSSSAITSLVFYNLDATNFNAGTVYIYGVK